MTEIRIPQLSYIQLCLAGSSFLGQIGLSPGSSSAINESPYVRIKHLQRDLFKASSMLPNHDGTESDDASQGSKEMKQKASEPLLNQVNESGLPLESDLNLFRLPPLTTYSTPTTASSQHHDVQSSGSPRI